MGFQSQGKFVDGVKKGGVTMADFPRVLNTVPAIPDASFVRDAYVAILNREPDPVGLEYFLSQLAEGALSREQMISALLASEEAKTCTGKGIFSIPSPGQTRYCFQPWQNLVLKADGTVYPCCHHPPVGTVSPERGLEDVLDGDSVRMLRHSLLAGRLDPFCARCRNRTVVDAEQFRRDFALKFFVADKTLNERGHIDLTRHPEVLERISFTGTDRGCAGLGERVFLRPTQAFPEPMVTFREIELDEPSTLYVHLYLDDPDSPTIGFRISVAEDPVNKIEAKLKGKQSVMISMRCSLIGRRFDVNCSVHSLTGSYEHAKAHLSYPFFDPIETM
jgi:hypothetical protein